MTLAIGQLVFQQHAKQIARLAEYEAVADTLSDPCDRTDFEFPVGTEWACKYVVMVLDDNFAV